MLVFSLENRFSNRKDTSEEIAFQEELEYFPIPLSASDSNLTTSFVDTWQGSRTYGGDRTHEGCDIITSLDVPGVYPVVSISDGIVEKLGWLELGGYRVGIRTDSGLYLYYAHLESYAPDLKEGDRITAGECIGFVGDTGYGEEGTTGQFVTHLHMGFYVPETDGDVAINPYPYLVELQKTQLKYKYQEP
ncbi:MAG: M23 family metallopeptidase [Eubacterium sp.]|nr:M23 family metallopeptidase [Eubacterium sp.]